MSLSAAQEAVIAAIAMTKACMSAIAPMPATLPTINSLGFTEASSTSITLEDFSSATPTKIHCP